MAIAPQINQKQTSLTNHSYRLIRHPLPPVSQPAQLSWAILQRVWWHTQGYGTVLGVMLLIGGSLVFLNLHWLARQLLRTELTESSVEDASSTS
jgi:hypothetical protein